MSATHGFKAAMAAYGLTPPESIPAGLITRCPGVGKGPANRSGWAFLFPDGKGGVFGNWATGLRVTWWADAPRPITKAERAILEAAKANHLAETAETHKRGRQIATKRWLDAKPADPNHPYLVHKQIEPFCARQEGKWLVLPIYEPNGPLTSIQTISPDGAKFLQAGGKKKGCFIPVRHIVPEQPSAMTIAVAEGFATAATIAMLYPAAHTVVAAIDAHNMVPVCVALRRAYPKATIIIHGDDDRRTPGNPGRTCATAAAKACGGKLALPPWDGTEPDDATDFNDWAIHHSSQGVNDGWE